MRVSYQQLLKRLSVRLNALLEAGFEPDPAGFKQLDATIRGSLNFRAMRCFCATEAFFWMLLCWLIWIWAGLLLVWHNDGRGMTQLLPLWTACIWLYPWLMTARKKQLHRLLRHFPG
jgi:hypothetical protein